MPEPRQNRARDFLKAQETACKAFLTYIRPRDLWSALYNILFVLTASLWFGRIPKMPVAFLVCLPFLYLSALGAALLFLAALRDRCIGEPRHALLRRLLGPESSLAAYLKRDGARMLRAAFAVGVYLFLGLLYLAVGPEKNNLGWLLMPCLLTGMAAIFSLNQRAEERASAEGEAGAAPRSFKATLIRSALYMALLVASLYILMHFLVLPLRGMLFGE
jgi:Ca2+/Na+ antiporter